METTSRLHPLLTAAAISVTVLSAVGVGALTGLVPHSFGSGKEIVELPQELVKPVAPAITHPVTKPAPKAVAKPAKPRRTEPVVEIAGSLATIQSVREVKEPGQHTGLGPIAGGVAGAVLGDQIGGKGTTRKVITVLGALGGAYAGREIEKQARATSHWEVDVRRDDGVQETVRSATAPAFHAGERVRVVDGRLQPA